MHHGTVDAVRRQVLHGEHLLPEGVLLHLPHRGLLAMRALTLTRRLTRAHDVPLSSGVTVPLLPYAWSTCTGDCELRCARCVLRSGPLPTSIVLVDIHLFWSAAVISYCAASAVRAVLAEQLPPHSASASTSTLAAAAERAARRPSTAAAQGPR